VLDDVNPMTGEKTSDIYVRGFLCDLIEEAQKTDTHFRSLNGEGKSKQNNKSEFCLFNFWIVYIFQQKEISTGDLCSISSIYQLKSSSCSSEKRACSL
jgi:hypothetical protein